MNGFIIEDQKHDAEKRREKWKLRFRAAVPLFAFLAILASPFCYTRFVDALSPNIWNLWLLLSLAWTVIGTLRIPFKAITDETTEEDDESRTTAIDVVLGFLSYATPRAVLLLAAVLFSPLS